MKKTGGFSGLLQSKRIAGAILLRFGQTTSNLIIIIITIISKL